MTGLSLYFFGWVRPKKPTLALIGLLVVPDLKNMTETEVLSCLTYFGKENLEIEESRFVWQVLVKVRGSVEEVTNEDLRQLGWVLRGVPLEHLGNLTLDEVDTIASLGRFHNLTVEQLQVLGERVLEDWAGKQPSDYSNYDLAALQHILCGFNRSIIEAIQPDAYKDAASALSTLRGCTDETLEALASLAISSDAFGPPSQWTSSQVKNVGCVLNGMSAQLLITIPPAGIESATPEIIPCLHPSTIKTMTSSQLLRLTPSAAAAFTPEQRSVISSEKLRAIAEAYEGLDSHKGDGSSIFLDSAAIRGSCIIVIFATIIFYELRNFR